MRGQAAGEAGGGGRISGAAHSSTPGGVMWEARAPWVYTEAPAGLSLSPRRRGGGSGQQCDFSHQRGVRLQGVQRVYRLLAGP